MKPPEQMAKEYALKLVALDLQTQSEAFESVKDFLAGYQAAKDQVADVSKVMLQWISVSDRLPPDTTKDWFVVLLDNMGCLKTIGSSQYIYGDWLQIREGLVLVTHWAEMPKELP